MSSARSWGRTSSTHIDNNAFTNRLAQWHLTQAMNLFDELRDQHPEAFAALGRRSASSRRNAIAGRRSPTGLVGARYREGVIEQFTGYFERDDVPITEWDENNMPRYPKGYNHFNCETTQLLKQPDVVMLMYLLPDEFDAEIKRANFDYYEARTLHKSSLSPSIHAIMGIEVGDTTGRSSISSARPMWTSATTRATPPRACTSPPQAGPGRSSSTGSVGCASSAAGWPSIHGCPTTGKASASASAGAAAQFTSPSTTSTSRYDSAARRRRDRGGHRERQAGAADGRHARPGRPRGNNAHAAPSTVTLSARAATALAESRASRN